MLSTHPCLAPGLASSYLCQYLQFWVYLPDTPSPESGELGMEREDTGAELLLTLTLKKTSYLIHDAKA